MGSSDTDDGDDPSIVALAVADTDVARGAAMTSRRDRYHAANGARTAVMDAMFTMMEK